MTASLLDRIAPANRILDLWAKGYDAGDHREVRRDTGQQYSYGLTSKVLLEARRAGDPRAVYRRKGA